MKPGFPFSARATVARTGTARHVPSIANHLEGHGARVSLEDTTALIAFDFAQAILQPKEDALLLHVAAADRSLLQEIKMEIAEHVAEFVGGKAGGIRWSGDASDDASPPNFRKMQVVASKRITPNMQRIRLTGNDLLRFTSPTHLHCKLLLPPPGRQPEWPYLDADGAFRWPHGPGKPFIRKYTIRAIDMTEATMDIDFVVHSDSGPGSTWASSAAVGDEIGIVGPGGRGIGSSAHNHYVLAGDETALPAIARFLETPPPGSRGIVLIEVSDKQEEQELGFSDKFEIRWLHRNGTEPGTSPILADAFRNLRWPQTNDDLFVWAGCEFSAFKDIRAFVRKDLRLRQDQHLITSYWRKGVSEDGPSALRVVRNILTGR